MSRKRRKEQNLPPLFIQTEIYTNTLKQAPASMFYRSELKYLIGKKVTLRGRYVSQNTRYVPFQRVDPYADEYESKEQFWQSLKEKLLKG